MPTENEVFTRTPSGESARLLSALRLTIFPVSHVVPGNAAGALLGRGLIRAVLALGGGSSIEHQPIRTRFRSRPVLGEWVGGRPAAGERIVYYLHGSAYVACSPATHRQLVARIVRRTDRKAFTLDYRLAPKFRFPAAHQDTVNGYLWLLSQGFRAEDILVAGDSAGGHLALALCGELRRLGLPQPTGLVLFSPLVDAGFDLAAAARGRVRDQVVHPRMGKALLGLYTRGADMTDVRLDVIQEIGPDLPPMLVQAGGREMMSADAEALGAAQQAAGGECELQVWPGQMHVFQILPWLPESKAALDEVRRFVTALDAQQPVPEVG